MSVRAASDCITHGMEGNTNRFLHGRLKPANFGHLPFPSSRPLDKMILQRLLFLFWHTWCRKGDRIRCQSWHRTRSRCRALWWWHPLASRLVRLLHCSAPRRIFLPEKTQWRLIWWICRTIRIELLHWRSEFSLGLLFFACPPPPSPLDGKAWGNEKGKASPKLLRSTWTLNAKKLQTKVHRKTPYFSPEHWATGQQIARIF